MLKPSRQPYGFKNLLAYQKSEELQKECSLLTHPFPPLKTLYALSDQMNRSARSVKQNIVEGWKRNSTQEYYDFLGFSIGALTELEEDCDDIWKGIYPELMGIRGVMGTPSTPLSPPACSTLSAPLNPLPPFDIEKLPFYPLDKNLPPVVQLKLRCKELNYLLHQLQKSLEQKMEGEKTLSAGDRARKVLASPGRNQKANDNFLAEQGFERLEDGRVVPKRE